MAQLIKVLLLPKRVLMMVENMLYENVRNILQHTTHVSNKGKVHKCIDFIPFFYWGGGGGGGEGLSW